MGVIRQVHVLRWCRLHSRVFRKGQMKAVLAPIMNGCYGVKDSIKVRKLLRPMQLRIPS